MISTTWQDYRDFVGPPEIDPGGGGGTPDDPPAPPRDPDDPYNPPPARDDPPPPPDPIPIYVTVEVHQWRTNGDPCPVCAALDGTTWEDDEAAGPPAHINCRCSSVVIERYRRLIGYEQPPPLAAPRPFDWPW